MVTRNQVILKAEDGHMLTQAGEVEILERLFVREIWLSDTDSADNYKEITQAEADTLIKEQRAAQEAKMMSMKPRPAANQA